MSVDDRMIHTLSIERASAGAPDDYGQPTQVWGAVASTMAFVSTLSAHEVALQSQGGAVVSTIAIGVPIGTDLLASDRLRHVQATCTVAVHDLPDVLYQPADVRDASGAGIYLRADATEIG